MPSAPAPASAGTSTTIACSVAPSASSAPGTRPTSSTRGSRPSTAWSRSSSRARVADVGCGYGAATILLGEAFPNSSVVGFDYHEARSSGPRPGDRCRGWPTGSRFEVAGAKDFTGTYDLVCLFDCLHDMGDPVGAAPTSASSSRPGGTLLLVEPAAGRSRPRTTTIRSDASCTRPPP